VVSSCTEAVNGLRVAIGLKMSDRNLPAPSTVGSSQEPTSQNLSNTMDSAIAMPNDGDIVYPTYGNSEPRNTQDMMGSAVPFVYDPTWMCKCLYFVRTLVTLNNLC
jgi:hypothetical protein